MRTEAFPSRQDHTSYTAILKPDYSQSRDIECINAKVSF